MAKFIAHRGNISGPQPDNENTIDYLQHAYSMEYDVEIDLIGHKGILYLGHDEPQDSAPLDFLQRPGVWCHAKNFCALYKMRNNQHIHYFWHQKDDFTLTSNNFIWCYPGKAKGKNCIALTNQNYFWCYPKTYIDHTKAVWLNFDGATMPTTENIYAICGDRVDENINIRTAR